MYPKATDGNEPNNYLFSSCSKHDMSSIISFRGPQCFIGELSKSRKTRREIKLKISLAFEMLGLNLQSFVLKGIFFCFVCHACTFQDRKMLRHLFARIFYRQYVTEGGGVKGEEEGKREGNGEQSLRVLTQSDSYK